MPVRESVFEDAIGEFSFSFIFFFSPFVMGGDVK
jgi:hypothetical protein